MKTKHGKINLITLKNYGKVMEISLNNLTKTLHEFVIYLSYIEINMVIYILLGRH